MARKSRQSFLKRQRERTRVEKAALKRARRQARRESPDATGTGGLGEPEGGLPPGEHDLEAPSDGEDVESQAPSRAASPGSKVDGRD
jgi:hypothetical protein